MVGRPNGSVSSTFPTTPTHPRLQTTLSSAGCRRLVHFIDYLTDHQLYLAPTWIDTCRDVMLHVTFHSGQLAA